MLTRITGFHNNGKFITLERNTSLVSQDQRWDFFNLEDYSYVHFSYRDLLDRPHEDYYQVPKIGGGWRTKDSEGIEILRRWKNAQKVELSTLTADMLLSMGVSESAKAHSK